MTSAKIHVLIIEDNLSDADVLQSMLEKVGATYTWVESHAQLKKALPQLPAPDLIFVDLELADATGYEALQTIRAYPELSSAPAVVYTSHPSEMANARKAGFHSFLGKPLRSATFDSQLSRILKGEAVWEIR